MTQRAKSCGEQGSPLEDTIGPDTPTARALVDLRQKIKESTRGPGGITKTAQEANMRRTVLARLVAPGVIRSVAIVERHLESK